jgi:uncharacterized membrane protein YfcA
MPDIDLALAAAGLFIGVVVGLTGMGGGALMTPVLVLFFGVQPLTAVSSDLVVSLIMKPVGGAVHLRRGTVNRPLVGWLVLGSVPSAFLGVLVLKALGDGERVQDVVKFSLGVALVLAAATIVAKAYMQMRAFARVRQVRLAGGTTPVPPRMVVRPLPTILIGVLGGFVVGMTSVGSGSLIIVLLLLLYPTIKSSEVVGTDLVQAVPLVGAAALGHLFFGDVQMDLTISLLVGGLPGVYLGARVSSRAPQALIRRALVLVLVASGLKLVGVDNTVLGVMLVAGSVLGPLLWTLARRRHGLPPKWRLGLRSPDGRRRLFVEALAVSPPDVTAATAAEPEPLMDDVEAARRSGG